MFRRFFPKMIERDFSPAGYARQVMKDLDMVLELAQQTKTPVPMSNTAASLYRMLIAKGYSELDSISVLKVYDNEPM